MLFRRATDIACPGNRLGESHHITGCKRVRDGVMRDRSKIFSGC